MIDGGSGTIIYAAAGRLFFFFPHTRTLAAPPLDIAQRGIHWLVT